MTIEITTLFSVDTAERLFATGLEVAQALGLPVTSWRTGDPTRSLYKYLARILAARDVIASDYIKAGFLSTAEDEWLIARADEVYGVTAPEATFADPTVTLTNTGGGRFELEAGDLTVKNSATDATYHNTSGTVLEAGDTFTFDLVADVAGSAGSAGTDEIDAIVSPTMQGVEVVSSTAGLATDLATNEEIRILCTDSLGALSPSGPADAYEFVALSADLTGNTSVNRAVAHGSTTGLVTVVIASQSGAADAAAILAVNNAELRYVVGLCGSVETVSAATTTVDRDVTVYVTTALTLSQADLELAVQAGYDQLFRATKIGGIDGLVSEDAQTNMIRALFDAGLVTRVTGCTDITLNSDEIPVRGTITVTKQ
jgi:hypothetical protein